MANLWDRMDGEPDRAWYYFQVYRDVPNPQRTYRYVAEMLGGVKWKTLANYGEKWQWRDRAAAYDSQVLQETSALAVAQDSRAAQRHVIETEGQELAALTRVTNQYLQGLIVTAEMMAKANAQAQQEGSLNPLTIQIMSGKAIKEATDLVDRLQLMRRRHTKLPTQFKPAEVVEDLPDETPVYFAQGEDTFIEEEDDELEDYGYEEIPETKELPPQT